MRPDPALWAFLFAIAPDNPTMKLQRITGLTVTAALAVGSLGMPAASLAAGHGRHHSHGQAARHAHQAHHSRRAHHHRRTRHGRRTHTLHHRAVMAHIALVGGAR